MSQEPPPRPAKPPRWGEAEIDKVVGVAAEQAKQRHVQTPAAGMRRGTNPNMAALRAPPLPADHEQYAATVPAPRQDAPTMRATPAAGMGQVRIEDAPASQPGTLPPASHSPHEAQMAALLRENERLRALHSLPPDRGAWAKLGYRIMAAVVGAAILVITALGARMANNLGKVEDKNVALTKKRKQDKEQLKTRDQLWNDWGDRMVEVLRCNHKKQAEMNKRQFPEVRLGEPGPWPIYKDSCGEIPERPRELPPPPVDDLPEP